MLLGHRPELMFVYNPVFRVAAERLAGTVIGLLISEPVVPIFAAFREYIWTFHELNPRAETQRENFCAEFVHTSPSFRHLENAP